MAKNKNDCRRDIETTEEYRVLLDESPEIIRIFDKNGKNTFTNKAASHFFGLPLKKLVGKTVEELLPEGKRPFSTKDLKKVIKTRKQSIINGVAYIRGKKKFLSVSLNPIKASSGKIESVMVIASEITPYKVTIDKLEKISNTLKVISKCNEALIRITDEQELLKEICKIIVDLGGYRFAWVGYAENDKNKTVRPIAQYGFEKDYLKSANITWSNNKRGRGPTGTAIRTKKITICKDMQTDPRFKPWRANAIKRGYASSVSLPIFIDGIIGAISIYAVLPDAFNNDEINLLKQLTNDLSYGIRNIRRNNEKTKVENQLRENEEKFRQMFESSAVGMSIIGLNGKWLKINGSVCRTLGYSDEELLSKNFLDVTFPDDVKKTKDLMKRLISGEINNGNLEKRCVKKDKTILWVYASLSLVRNSNGKPLYFVAVTENIDLRKKAEDKLKKSDELVRNVNSILLRWTPNGIISFINDYGSKMFGYDKDELIGKNVEILVPRKESTGRELSFLIKDITQHPEKYIVNENENIKKDGSRFWVGWANRAMKDKGGNLIEILAVGNDITERLETENKLKDSEEKLSLIFNNSRFGMSIVSPDGRWLKVNNGLSEIIGYSEDELTSKNFLQLTFADDIQITNSFFKKLISGEIDNGYLEKRYVHKDGHIVWVYLSVSLVRDLKDKPLYFIVIIENITERKRLDEAKDTFLSLASHQLRTPLAAIKWVLESLMGEKESFTPRQQIKLNDLTISNERIIRLVNYLLNVTRIESGKLMINKKLTNLRELINDVVASLRSLSKEKEIKIIIPEKLKDIYCDPLLISEALGNLLNNAINYSTENSKDIVVEVEDRDLYYIVSIHNDGFIDEQTLFKINKFERFVRGENAMKVQPSGSGLGLYVTNRIIQLSGGNLWLESNAKAGTTFYFTIVKKHPISRS